MFLRIIFISVGFLLLGCSTNSQTLLKEKKLHDNTTNHPVRALYLSSIEAFNAGKLELFLSNFDSDIKMFGTDGMYIGKDALRQRFKVIFEQFPNKKMEIPELKLQILAEETVLVHFKWKLYPMGQGPAYSGEGSGLYILKDSKWVEILEVETVTDIDEALMQNTGK